MSEAREDVWDEAEVVHSARMVELWAMHELEGVHRVSSDVRLGGGTY